MRCWLTGAALVLAIVAGGWFGWSVLSAPCGWLGRDGCEARLRLRNLTIVGDTIASDVEGRLWLAGWIISPGGAAMIVSRPGWSSSGPT
ncbi:hypothetical protein [Gemmobacter sp. 24YEA27]|uniref:hypothetical protein n=1 Tax=Gemmobacter sp. 24YEA27 TaxID=3040672 RepID=UPI0024B34109|nr:hypothetical protein [Gemmobacter sp. 24YEA27]